MKRWIYILAIIAAAIGIAGLTIVSMTFDSEMSARVNIPRNSTKENVRDSLESALGHESGSWVYRLWAVASGDALQAHGSYLVEPGQSLVSVAKSMAGGRQTPVKITINNIRTLPQLTKLLSDKLEATPQEIDAALAAVVKTENEFDTKHQIPAAVLPDTYEFYWTDTAEHVVDKLLNTRNSFWTASRREKAAALGLTPVEVATIASIVEEESAKKDERPTIARLYINRVHKGMKLQADPTVKFATGNFALRRITGTHLKTDSPYNTYLNAGLPPGPIRIPSAETIDMVLNSPPNPYLYMCAKEDFSGYHNFATTYAQHMANAKRYQAALNKRKIYK